MYGDDPVLCHAPPLTREQELECVRHIRARDEHADLAMKDLVEQVLPLVVSIAQRHSSDHALLTAVPTFVDSSADNFASCAEPFIEDALLQAADKQGRTLICVHLRSSVANFSDAITTQNC